MRRVFVPDGNGERVCRRLRLLSLARAAITYVMGAVRYYTVNIVCDMG
jgi:hypothetical protein